MKDEKEYLNILSKLDGDQNDIFELKKFINHYFHMIEFMKNISLYDVFRYENAVPNLMKESMKMILDQNVELKAEINTLRKKLGKIEKYD